MKNANGMLLTNENDIRNEAVKHCKKVFEEKPIDDELKDYKKEREDLCDQRLREAAKNKTPPWTIQDAIKNLNTGISKDPNGHPNELFKNGVAGVGLLCAITALMNKLKDNPEEYPASMDICNVTSIYKNKGDKIDFWLTPRCVQNNHKEKHIRKAHI